MPVQNYSYPIPSLRIEANVCDNAHAFDIPRILYNVMHLLQDVCIQ